MSNIACLYYWSISKTLLISSQRKLIRLNNWLILALKKKKIPNFVFEEEEESLRFKRSRRGGIEFVFNEGVRPLLDFYLSFSTSFGWVLREWWIQCGFWAFWLSWGRGSDRLCRLGMERNNGEKKILGNRELK